MYFGIAIVLGIIFVVGLLAAVFSRDKFPGAGAAVGALVVLGIVTALFSATTVAPRSVGIQTSFGKYDATLQNGLHWTAPWSSVEEFSTQVQPLDIEVPVAFEGGSSGVAEVTVRWAIDEDGAERLWNDWKTFDRVRDNLVKPDSRTAFRTEFSNYTPVDAIDGANLNTISANVTQALEATFKDRGILLDSVTVTEVKLGERAQASLDRIVSANADVERAQAEQDKAKIDAETAAIQAQTQTPETILRRCLEIVNNWDVNKNGNLPATFNCALGDTTQTPVIVNGG